MEAACSAYTTTRCHNPEDHSTEPSAFIRGGELHGSAIASFSNTEFVYGVQ